MRKSKHPMYKTWVNMRNRSEKPYYASYRKLNISCCDDWLDFWKFVEDMAPKPLGRYSLDRIDTLKGYSKDNCRWATYVEQARNTTSNHIIIFEGSKYILTMLAEKFNIKRNTLLYRLRRGWSLEEALEVKPRKQKVYSGRLSYEEIKDIVTLINSGYSQLKCARLYGIDGSQINRIYHKFKNNLHVFEEEID